MKGMGWFTYYKLYEKYNGEFGKATVEEKTIAANNNPASPYEARMIAKKKWEAEHPDTQTSE